MDGPVAPSYQDSSLATPAHDESPLPMYTMLTHPTTHQELPRYSTIGQLVEYSTRNLPRYSAVIGQLTDHTISRLGVLPRYSTVVGQFTEPTSPRAPSTEHEFHLMTTKNKPWLTLTLLSSAGSSKNVPKFFEGKDVTGSVALKLHNTDTIHSVSISVRGRIITGAYDGDSYTFLDNSITLWSKAMGDPRNPLFPTDGKFNEKLFGDYVFPFSFSFPAEVSLSAGSSSPKLFHLPQTFRERNTGANIQYDLIVHISRGRLRADSKLQAQIAYIPSIIPDPPSLLRQLAYRESRPLCGPVNDPEGWFTLPPTIIRGQLLNVRPTEIKCTLSLAKPLCYTRGSVIPCSLAIQTFDSQTLDLIASPNTVVVRLRRRLKYFISAGQALSKKQSIASSVVADDVESAVWWKPSEDSPNEACECQLEGEIHLANDLAPSSDFTPFTIEYSVVLLPFLSPSFISADKEPSIAQTVQIATVFTTGPRPKAFTARPSTKIDDSYRNPDHGGVRSAIGVDNVHPHGSIYL